jgi:arsenate reductase
VNRKPAILFLCTHNAGRSQIAAAFARTIGAGGVDVFSAGSAPAEEVNPRAALVMAELGIDIAGQRPIPLNERDLHTASIVVTMGCGDACPFIAGKRYLDWALDDPAQLDLEGVRRVRDEIQVLVQDLLAGIIAEAEEAGRLPD